MIQLIQRYIRPGSTIYSDGLPAYNELGALEFNHSGLGALGFNNFVDPITGVHTNGVEAYWSRAKRKLNGNLQQSRPHETILFGQVHVAREIWPQLLGDVEEHMTSYS